MFLSSLWQKLSSHLQSSPIDYFLNFQYKVSLNQLQIEHWNNLLILHVDGALSRFFGVCYEFFYYLFQQYQRNKNHCLTIFAIIYLLLSSNSVIVYLITVPTILTIMNLIIYARIKDHATICIWLIHSCLRPLD